MSLDLPNEAFVDVSGFLEFAACAEVINDEVVAHVEAVDFNRLPESKEVEAMDMIRKVSRSFIVLFLSLQNYKK